jgi:hypothetical protein
MKQTSGQKALTFLIISLLAISVSVTMGNDARGCWGQKLVDFKDSYLITTGSSGADSSGDNNNNNNNNNDATPPPPALAGWRINSNPSNSFEVPTDVAVDGSSVYLIGFDLSLGNSQWRIEKRSIASGALIAAFDTDGVVTNNPSAGSDSPYAVVADGGYLYLGGNDVSPGNQEWRVEKRDATTGALVNAFDTDGVVTTNPGNSDDSINDLATDANYIYLVGFDSSLGAANLQWRIEKRDKITGALVNAFDTDGVVTTNPSNADDSANAIVVDNSYIYIIGVDSAPGNTQWRIEKRDKTTGALVNAFDTDGVVTTNPSNAADSAASVASDNSYLYIAGYDNSLGNPQWRIEKRDKTTGALVAAFDADGVVTSNPSAATDSANGIAVDADYIYIIGNDNAQSSQEWRIEKRNITTGALVSGFDTDGVLLINPGAATDNASDIALDSNYLYISGYELTNGAPPDQIWRLEKRIKTTGGQ